MDQLFEDLINECEISTPDAQLSISVKNRLEEQEITVRREIVSRVKGDGAALFIACKRGHVKIVEYLITVCNADIEQRGLFEVPADESVYCVPPLWCAAYAGKLPVVKCLIYHGAEINAISDYGSTPVRSTCSTSRLDIIEYLLKNGADISKANYTGETCLINSIQSVEVCTFLLEHGVNVNASDIRNKTALHYAIEEHRFETVKLLLDHNADPYFMSLRNDDALQTACIEGVKEIFDYLVDTIPYSSERLADANKLMGTTRLDVYDDTQTALKYWRKAMTIRIENGIDNQPSPKKLMIPKRDCYRNAVEFSTLDELNSIAHDSRAMRIQSLLICERILGEHHDFTLYRLLCCGQFYADACRYQECIDLWRRTLELRVQRDSILCSNACYMASSVVRAMVDFNSLRKRHEGENEQRFHDIVAVLKLLTSQLTEMRQLLERRPVYKSQQDSYDGIFKCVIYLIYLLVETAQTVEQQSEARELVRKLVEQNPRSASSENTLLHLCLSNLDQLTTCYFIPQDARAVFPHVEIVQLLLDCGANVNARNGSRSTPLHVASNADHFDSHLIKLLLDFGAHVDTPNLKGDTPQRLLSSNPQNSINFGSYMTLRCYAAQAIVKYGLQYDKLPTSFHEFLELHKV